MLKKIFRYSILSGIFLFLLFLGYVFFVPQNTSDTIIELERGDRLSTVLEKLYDKKIIRSKLLFKLYMYLSLNQNHLKIGEYSVSKNSTLYDIKNVITSGRMYNKYLTIPEGLTKKQIFEIINSYNDLQGEININIAEGELLPQTYAYNKTTSKDELLLRMKSDMETLINTEWKNRADNLPLKNINEAITLASMVEKETGIPEERALVASVFINRLNKNMRLQSDPTVIYTLTNKYGNMQGKRLYKKDLDVNTPYNTYKIKGLPAGPIANPGIESIRAVLHPADTNFLYFVADGTGGHKFATTLEEHEKNRAEWKRIRDK